MGLGEPVGTIIHREGTRLGATRLEESEFSSLTLSIAVRIITTVSRGSAQKCGRDTITPRSAALSYEYIIVEQDNNVGVITLNRRWGGQRQKSSCLPPAS